MKSRLFIFLLFFFFIITIPSANAQCAMCTKTAQQLGEKPAKGMNSGILYLMLSPFLIVGYIGYRWWKNREESEK